MLIWILLTFALAAVIFGALVLYARWTFPADTK